jgi:hypothetical protein
MKHMLSVDNKGEVKMIYLIQLYKMVHDKKLFINVFSDLDFELEEMGWKDDPEGLIEGMLFNHFGLEIDDEKQLSSLTKTILKKKDLSFLETFK